MTQQHNRKMPLTGERLAGHGTIVGAGIQIAPSTPWLTSARPAATVR